MTLPIKDLLATVTSHAEGLGIFETVLGHEPLSAPGGGITCAVWFDRMRVIRTSGLANTSALVTFFVRLYLPMVQQPEDEVEREVAAAADKLIAEYAADFTLDAKARQVDLFGIHGQPLTAEGAYMSESGNEYRTNTITLPIVVDDLWPQEA